MWELIPSSAFGSFLFVQSIPSFGREEGWSLDCPSRCKTFLQEETSGSWFPGHPWEFFSSTSSLDYHLLSSFLLPLRQRPCSFTPGRWSVWSHPRACCGWEEADPWIISLLTSKTQCFLLLNYREKVMPRLGISDSILATWKTFFPCLGSGTSSLHLENGMNVIGLWFCSRKNEPPNEVW